MRVITAPENYSVQPRDITCFLAGGITGCHNWQGDVINYIHDVNLARLVLFNPRRSMPTRAIEEQIKWEYRYLNCAEIFSIYFCDSDSVQPICMYELGRYLNIFTGLFSGDELKRHCIVSAHKNYSRLYDVLIQTELATDIKDFVNIVGSPLDHADAIIDAYLRTVFE